MKVVEDDKLSLGEQLMQAIKDNELKTAQELLSKDPTLIDYQDQDGNTALHIAAFNSRNHIAKILLENDANEDTKNKYGFVPGLIPIGNQLITEVSSGNIKEVKKLLKKYPELINFKDGSNSTPLHAACIKLDFNLVKFLLNKGANINAQDENGKSPLHEAVLFRVGVEETAIIEGKDNVSRTKEQIELIDQNYQERLKQARASGIETIKLLIAKGPDISAVTSQGDTALHIAAQSAYPTEKVATILIEAGINIDTKNNSNEIASDIATKEKKEALFEAIELGSERHADVGLENTNSSKFSKIAKLAKAIFEYFPSLIRKELSNIKIYLSDAASFSKKMVTKTELDQASLSNNHLADTHQSQKSSAPSLKLSNEQSQHFPSQSGVEAPLSTPQQKQTKENSVSLHD